MTKIPEEFQFGDVTDLQGEELLRMLRDMYRTLAVAINSKATVTGYKDATGAWQDGSTTSNFLAVGTINVNEDSDKVEMLTSYTDPRTVVWTQLSP